MAKKVSLENNILKIDNGVKVIYHNAAWCDMNFTATEVVITNWGVTDTLGERSVSRIKFTEFQDATPTAYTTEAAIATYLSDKIG